MKKLISALLLIIAIQAQAYNIGGAYATLVRCSWGSYGYQYGYIGTYVVQTVSGEQFYQIFFGQNYCRF